MPKPSEKLLHTWEEVAEGARRLWVPDAWVYLISVGGSNHVVVVRNDWLSHEMYEQQQKLVEQQQHLIEGQEASNQMQAAALELREEGQAHHEAFLRGEGYLPEKKGEMIALDGGRVPEGEDEGDPESDD